MVSQDLKVLQDALAWMGCLDQKVMLGHQDNLGQWDLLGCQE